MQSIFFKYAKPIQNDESELDYTKMQIIPYIFDCISDIIPHNAFIFDYYRKNFFSITKDSIILCGYAHEDAMKMGHAFFDVILDNEELRKMEEVNEAGFKLFYSISEEKRRDAYISYNLRLNHRNGTELHVNNRYKPLLFCPDGNIWLAVCSIQPALNKTKGDVFVSFKASNERMQYSFKNKCWQSMSKLELTTNERIVALETEKGTPEKIIAQLTDCTRSGVQYYKTRILQKTQSPSIREAVVYLRYIGVL